MLALFHLTPFPFPICLPLFPTSVLILGRAGKLRPQHSSYYPGKIYLFTGRESIVYANHGAIHGLRSVLKNGPSQTSVKNFNSLRTAALRAVAWDKSAHVVVFPSFADYPDLHMINKADIKVHCPPAARSPSTMGICTLA